MDLRIYENIFDRNPGKNAAISNKMIHRIWQYCFGPKNRYTILLKLLGLKDSAYISTINIY
jgi:hypothetical protein